MNVVLALFTNNHHKEKDMRKILLLSVIAICILLCSCKTQESSGSRLYPSGGSVGLAYEANEDGTCSVTGRGTCTDQCIVIPSTSPDGQRVTTIKEKAFFFDNTLLSITLPETLESIEKDAFFQCTKLYEIINLSRMGIDKGYVGYHGDIGRYAKEIHKGPGKMEEQDGFFFYEIDGENYLIYSVNTESDIIFPESLHGESYSILPALFSLGQLMVNPDERLITSITFPDNALINMIGDGAFKNHQELISVTFGDNCQLERIGMFAFSDCFALESVNFGSSNRLKSIGYSAFESCAKLRTFDFSLLKNLETIECKAFWECKNLSAVELQASVSWIEEDAFTSCWNLTLFTFADGSKITEIPSDMLHGCYRLTEIRIPEGVTTIGASAFWGTSLTTIYLPAGLETVEYGAFAVDTNYVQDGVKVYYAGTEADFEKLDFSFTQWGLRTSSTEITYDYKP